MKNFYKLGAYAFAMLLGLSACSKDTPEEQEKTPQNPTEGKTIYLSLNGAFNAEEDSRTQLHPTESDKIKVEFTNQELFSGPDNARVKGPKTGKLTFYIVNDTDLSNVTKAEVDPTDFRKNPDGTYSISYAGPITLKNGADFNTGNWYICGGYCLNNHDSFYSTLYLNQEKILDRALGSMGSDPILPFIFGWTKLDTWSNNHSLKKDSGVKKGIKFLPDAFFSRVHVINNFVEDVQLLSFHLYTNNNFTFGRGNNIMYYDPQPTVAQLTAGTLPRVTNRKFRYNNSDNITYSYQVNAYQAGGIIGASDITTTANNPTGKGWKARTLAAGEYFTEYFRMIGPTNSSDSCMIPALNNGIMKYATYYDNWDLGTTAGGTALDSRDTDGIPSGQKTANWWRGASYLDGKEVNKAPAITSEITYAAQSYRDRYLENGKFRRGRVNNINYKTSSDLMITELYTTRISSNGKSYGLIEIYNPTLDAVDLSNYALMRINHTASGNNQTVRVVPKTDKITYSYDASTGTVTPIGSIDEALLQPLDFQTGAATGLWAINSLNQPYRHASVVDNINRVQFDNSRSPLNKSYTGYNTRMRDYASATGILSNLKAVQPGKTMLSPGKTILILFSGFVDSSYKPTTAEEQALFAKIQKAITAGYCEYVVALDNSQVQGAMPSEAGSGVMTADLGDSFSLVKTTKIHKEYNFVEAKGIKEQMRLVVDGTWSAHPYDPKGVINKLLNDTNVKGILRRPYGPYIWNVGFLDRDASERYYQKEFKLENATFGVPYHTSYDKSWSQVVEPKIKKRDAALFKK